MDGVAHRMHTVVRIVAAKSVSGVVQAKSYRSLLSLRVHRLLRFRPRGRPQHLSRPMVVVEAHTEEEHAWEVRGAHVAVTITGVGTPLIIVKCP
ncbi:hypothetical protein ACN47E_007224 [Coniothyrium glycines]